MKQFLKHARQPEILLRALRVAGVVGTLLGVINHYDMFLTGVFPVRRVLQLVTTYIVPFCVATYSAAMQRAAAGRR
jgi:hypothetical protein